MLTVILAGGMSRRMGRDKAVLEYGGVSLLEHAVRRYSTLGSVAVSVDRAGRFDTFGAAELADVLPGGGPLNGICSAFMNTRADAVFLTAVDMPLAEPEAARRIMELLDGHEACAPDAGGKIEPLFAAYSRRSLEAALDCLRTGGRSFRELLGRLDVRTVTPAELAPHWREGMLRNINTPADHSALTGSG